MVVIDTSVAYKWFSKEEIDHDSSMILLEQHLSQKNKIVVPDLILYELTNVWVTKTQITLIQIKNNLNIFNQYHLELISPNMLLINKAIKLGKKYNISGYDAIYVALAKEKKCSLITADTKLIKKVGLSFVRAL